MTTHDQARSLLADTVDQLDRLDGLLEGDQAGRLPVVAVARLIVDLDRTSGELTRHLEVLTAAGSHKHEVGG